MACLKVTGDSLITAVNDGPIVGKTSLKSRGGTSLGESEGFKWPTISWSVTGSKWSKTAVQGTYTEGSMQGGEISAQAEVTLSRKKWTKFSHTTEEVSIPTVCGAFKAELITLHRTRGLWEFNRTMSEKYCLSCLEACVVSFSQGSTSVFMVKRTDKSRAGSSVIQELFCQLKPLCVKCASLTDPDLWCLSEVWNGCIFIVMHSYKLWCLGCGSHLLPSTTMKTAPFSFHCSPHSVILCWQCSCCGSCLGIYNLQVYKTLTELWRVEIFNFHQGKKMPYLANCYCFDWVSITSWWHIQVYMHGICVLGFRVVMNAQQQNWFWL